MAYPSDLTRTKNWGTETLTDSDLEGQFDLIINWAMAVVNSSTGHTHDGTSNQGPKINITNLTVGSQALGDLIYGSSSTAWARLAGNTTTTQKFLVQTGTGAVSAAPSWGVLATTDLPAGTLLQAVSTQTGAVSTGTTVLPWDDSVPQNTEGDQFMSLAITPKASANTLYIDVTFNFSSSADDECTIALFQDTTANALAAVTERAGTNPTSHTVRFTHVMTAGTTSATTFKVRAGNNSANTMTFNGSGGNRKLGGVMASSIVIREVKV